MRLPYADQGYVDDDADAMGKFMNLFGGKKKETKVVEEPKVVQVQPPKNDKFKFPWDK